MNISNLPRKARKIYKDLKAIEQQRDLDLQIIVNGPKGAGKSTLIDIFGRQRFDVFIEENSGRNLKADLTITVITADKKIDKDVCEYLKQAKKSNGIVVLNKLDKVKNIDQTLSGLDDLGIDFKSVVPVSAVSETGIDDLKKKISDYLGVEKFALAYQVPSFTSLAIEATVKATAKQNALIATVAFIPGADMPVLTANQIKMILEIAAAYGVTLDWQRAKEILAVVATGYGFREIARQLLDFAPGPGWIVKGAVAYSGTLAVAKAADLYFSKVVE